MWRISKKPSSSQAALAWVAKSLIDSMMIEIGSSTPNAAAVLPWLSIALGLAVLDSVAGSVRTYLSRRLADDLNLKVTADILTHAADLDIEFFEDIGNQDSLQRAKRTTGGRLTTLISQTFGTISSALQVVTLAAVLVVIQPWTLLVVALVAPPFLLVRWILARREYALEYNRATKRRWTGYFVGLLTRHRSVAETRLLGLAPLLIRNHRSLIAEFRDQNRGMYLANLRTVLVFAVVSTGAFYALLVEVAFRALDGAATLGDVAVFFGASARLRGGLQSGVDSLTGLLQGSLHISALMEFFENKSPARASGEPVTSECAGAIKVQNVDFTYAGSSEPVLRDLSFALRVADFNGLTSGPVQFTDGTPSSGLSYTFVGLGDPGDDVEFSNDNGVSFSYMPVADASGADITVTHIRILPKNAFLGDTGSGNPSADFAFKTIVR